ncbi:MAG: hypothetical protein JW908_14800, partial [Anaerolineales bacterium]|nr:hypothetical protein [Anaerolineales bacterium]
YTGSCSLTFKTFLKESMRLIYTIDRDVNVKTVHSNTQSINILLFPVNDLSQIVVLNRKINFIANEKTAIKRVAINTLLFTKIRVSLIENV